MAKKNPQDATTRNIRASAKRDHQLRLKVEQLSARLDHLAERVALLERRK